MFRRVAIAPRAAALVAVAAILGAAGCGTKKNDLAPAACLVGNEAYLHALERAPRQVRLAGTTPISDCLVPEQDAGQLANIGHEMIIAATKLNAEARRDPTGPGHPPARLPERRGREGRRPDPHRPRPAAQLGRPVHADRGHAAGAFERAFGRGYAAGHSSG